MLQQHGWRARGRLLLIVLLGALGLATAPPARAGDLSQLDTSLKWIPADAAGYAVWLRNREQLDAVLKSNAWAKLKALPAVQMAVQMGQAEIKKPGNPLGQALQLYDQPENRQLVELLGDLFAQEVFVYGGASFTDFMDLTAQTLGAMRFGPAIAKLGGAGKDLSEEQQRVHLMLQTLGANLDLIKAPDLIVGFKLTKTDAAEAQLKRLEELAGQLVALEPSLKGRLKRAKVAGGDFLTLTLDGKLVPWDKIDLKPYETEPGEHDKLLKKLKGLKLTVSLGVRDGYLLLAFGESTATLTQLGGGKERLIDRPEFKPLAKFSDQRLTSIGYTSQALNSRISTNKKDVKDWVELANNLLSNAPLTDDQRKQIRQDIEALGKDVRANIPEVGAELSFSFLTGRGTESYAYDWGEHPNRVGNKPLTLLNHVGGAPLLAAVSRSKYSPDSYRTLVKWIKKANGYAELFAVPQMTPEQQDQYKNFTKAAHPLLRRLDEITSTLLLPALADGQTGFVLDAKMKSKRWFQGMPESDKPLPMLEPALLVGVSDTALLQKAFGEYRVTLNELLAAVREQVGDQFPPVEIPAPESRKVKGGTLYYYGLPGLLGLDPQIFPNAGVGQHVAALSISEKQTERLLASTPLKTDGGPLAMPDRPLAGATYVHCEGMVTAVTPWVEYAVRVSGVSRMLPAAGGDGTEDLLKQVHTVLDVLKVFRSYSSATYFEDKVLVTHSETVIRDL